MSRVRTRIGLAAAIIASGLALSVATPTPAPAAPNCQGPVTTPCVVQPGLVIEPIITSFPSYPTIPVNFVAAPNNGPIYVADKSGRVLVYSSGRGDSSADVVLDIRAQVHDFWDRGILGMAIDPQYGQGNGNDFVYILYTLDRDTKRSTTVPRWGSNVGGEFCPDPPGGGGSGADSGDGCVVDAEIRKLQVNPTSGALIAQQVIFGSNASRGWCTQYPSHSVGSLHFGVDGMLYASVGDGASFDQPDWGQLGGDRGGGIPRNPCQDPGNPQDQWDANDEGGSLRSQSVRSTVADGYQPLDGAIIRIDKNGNVPGNNPLVGGADTHGDDDAIVAYGLRNPFRWSFKPGTNEIWVGDVGASTREEVSRSTVGNGQTTVPNFGWPCREGNGAGWEFSLNRQFALCTSLTGTSIIPGTGVVSPLVEPVLAYGHTSSYWDLNVDAGCKPVSSNSPGSSVTGGAFATASDWPAAVNGAYVFGDYARQCLWAVTTTQQYSGEDPELLAKNLTPLASSMAPVAVRTAADGSVWVLDIGDGNVGRQPGIWRIGTPSSPIARFTMSPASSAVATTVSFNASSSFVLPGATITGYEWDLDGNGSFETTGTATPSRAYAIGAYNVRLRVTDSNGQSNETNQRLQIGNPPVLNGLATSIGPAGHLENDTVVYDIDATDPGGLGLVYSVQAIMRHCDTVAGDGCHEHTVGALTPDGEGRGSFVVPGHAGFSFMQLLVTVTNSAGLTTSQRFDLKANWLDLNIDTFPTGLQVSRAGGAVSTPYRAVEIGQNSTLIATTPVQTRGGVTNFFTGWADAPAAGPARTLAPAAGTVSLIAQFAPAVGLTSIAPVRVLDTRVGTGAPAGLVPATGVVRLDLRAAGVPQSATAAMLNVTVAEGTGAGFVTAYPCSQPRPLSSNLNYTAGTTAANLVQVAVDAAGLVCLYAHGATHLVADLSGWFEPTGKPFAPATPSRVLDTRVGTGAPVAKLAAGQTLTLDLSALAPAGATSAVLNLTSTEADAPGYVTAYPCGGERPLASNLNVGAGDTRPNQAVVALAPNGSVCLYAFTSMHLVADLLGWYGTSGVKMATQAPERVLDTRDGTGGAGTLGAGGTVELDLSAQAPPGATGVVLNVTGVEPTTDSFVTVYPCGIARPLASNLNLTPRSIRPNLVTVPLGAAGKVCLFSQAPIDLVADVAGWAVDVP